VSISSYYELDLEVPSLVSLSFGVEDDLLWSDCWSRAWAWDYML